VEKMAVVSFKAFCLERPDSVRVATAWAKTWNAPQPTCKSDVLSLVWPQYSVQECCKGIFSQSLFFGFIYAIIKDHTVWDLTFSWRKIFMFTSCELVSMYQCFRGKILLMKKFSCVIFL
jgi:hypothetical protein